MQFLLGTHLTEQCVMKLLNFVYELNFYSVMILSCPIYKFDLTEMLGPCMLLSCPEQPLWCPPSVCAQ
jgi:hypothetical protein